MTSENTTCFCFCFKVGSMLSMEPKVGPELTTGDQDPS